jgi:hypothetical protein
MIFTDYYKGEKLTKSKHRFDVTTSTGEYDFFEGLLINKRIFNIGGLSFNYVPQPDSHKGKQVDAILSKGSFSISKVIRPNLECNLAYGDIHGTNDGFILVFNSDFKEAGVNSIEIFIARGAKSDRLQLYQQFSDGEYKHEIEILIKNSVAKNVTWTDQGAEVS